MTGKKIILFYTTVLFDAFLDRNLCNAGFSSDVLFNLPAIVVRWHCVLLRTCGTHHKLCHRSAVGY